MFVAIDEISMIGAKRFAAMHLRLAALYPSLRWLAFDSVCFLVQQMRQSGDASFLNVLQDQRNCIVSQRVIEYLGPR
ncbi:hypothetical protein H9P43_004815 [Blastocladiella emersonii ATCC 22665]|nr:hypothetical protein H9P43_004815 [Blastocladiella emersonii ATCC 22665]